MIDKLQRFPDQNSEGRFETCMGETVGDVGGNIWGIPMDAGFSQAAGYAEAGLAPSILGEDAMVGMDGAIAYGLLPQSAQTFNSLNSGTLYENDFNNYSAQQKATALKFALNGLVELDTWAEISNHLNTTQTGVQMTMRWYASFNERMGPNGTLLPPDPYGEPFTVHSVAVYGASDRLQIKPWKGAGFGVGGYCYIDSFLFSKVFVSASGFNQNAMRWISLLGIAARRYPQFLPFLPTIIANILKKNLA